LKITPEFKDFAMSAKGADARRQTGEERANSSGGALNPAPVLREALQTVGRRVSKGEGEPPRPTGPKTPEGKAISSQNRFTFGFNAANFIMLPWEDKEEFDQLLENLKQEFQPASPSETMLVEKMAQHYWLTQRALAVQSFCFSFEGPAFGAMQYESQLPLYMRYQVTHERAYYRCRKELMESRRQDEKRYREFVSQKRTKAEAEERRAKEAETEKRKIAEAFQREGLQRARIRLANAKAEHQELKNQALSHEQTSKQFVPQNDVANPRDVIEVPLEKAA
jgi:hypothetical protein